MGMENVRNDTVCFSTASSGLVMICGDLYNCSWFEVNNQDRDGKERPRATPRLHSQWPRVSSTCPFPSEFQVLPHITAHARHPELELGAALLYGCI